MGVFPLPMATSLRVSQNVSLAWAEILEYSPVGSAEYMQGKHQSGSQDSGEDGPPPLSSH